MNNFQVVEMLYGLYGAMTVNVTNSSYYWGGSFLLMCNHLCTVVSLDTKLVQTPSNCYKKSGTGSLEFSRVLRVFKCDQSCLVLVKITPGSANSLLWNPPQQTLRGNPQRQPPPFPPEQLGWLQNQFGKPMDPPPDPVPFDN